jgi:predicted small secreted protein
MKKLIALTLLAITVTITMAGCNTIAGVGKDVQKAGQAVQGAAGH